MNHTDEIDPNNDTNLEESLDNDSIVNSDKSNDNSIKRGRPRKNASEITDESKKQNVEERRKKQQNKYATDLEYREKKKKQSIENQKKRVAAKKKDKKEDTSEKQGEREEINGKTLADIKNKLINENKNDNDVVNLSMNVMMAIKNKIDDVNHNEPQQTDVNIKSSEIVPNEENIKTTIVDNKNYTNFNKNKGYIIIILVEKEEHFRIFKIDILQNWDKILEKYIMSDNIIDVTHYSNDIVNYYNKIVEECSTKTQPKEQIYSNHVYFRGDFETIKSIKDKYVCNV